MIEDTGYMINLEPDLLQVRFNDTLDQVIGHKGIVLKVTGRQSPKEIEDEGGRNYASKMRCNGVRFLVTTIDEEANVEYRFNEFDGGTLYTSNRLITAGQFQQGQLRKW